MAKLNFKTNKTIDFENEAGLLIFNYLEYKSYPNPGNIDWENSYIDYKNSDKKVAKIEEYFKDHPTYMNFLREVRSASFYLIEKFFDDKNQDILTLFSIYEEGDEKYFPFMVSIFQNLDRQINEGFAFDSYKELYDLFFYKYLGLDYFSLIELGFNNYEELKGYMNRSKLMDYLANSPFTDIETMTLLRGYQNTKDLYDRLKTLINKLSKIIKDKTYIIDDLIHLTFEDLKNTDYKIVQDFTKQISIDEMIGEDNIEIYISILLLAPFAQMFSYMYFSDFNKVFKFGILVDKVVNKENTHKLSNISQDLATISDPTRIQILDFLKESDHYAKELSDKLYITPATLSYHLNKLLISGFVGLRKEGRRYYYYLRKNGFEYLIENLAKFNEDIKETHNDEN